MKHRLAPIKYRPSEMCDQERADAAYCILRDARSDLEALYKSCRTATVADAIGRVLDAWPAEGELYDLDLAYEEGL